MFAASILSRSGDRQNQCTKTGYLEGGRVMPIYQITKDSLLPVAETNFGVEGIYERKDIQRLLKDKIAVLDERLIVISEEFGDWLDSSRRIDLLCLDTEANLVVIELKRTDDGGRMELQAIRYAAMVSTMTFNQMVGSLARFRSPNQPNTEAAQSEILQFLGWDDVYEDQFGLDTRIILVAADFSKELTTAVMWLNDRSLDIRCIRIKPYKMLDGTVLLDVQQLIPLPEVAAFQTQIGVKKQAERQNRTERHDLRYRFWDELLKYAKTKTGIHANRNPSNSGWIAGGIGRAGFSLTYSVRQNDSQVELWIGLGAGQGERNLAAFYALEAQQTEIEKEFGESLEWQELRDRDGCRIRKVIQGGYRSPPGAWPELHMKMVDAMIRLNNVMHDRVLALRHD